MAHNATATQKRGTASRQRPRRVNARGATPKLHDIQADADPRLLRLSDEALTCRVESHDWPKRHQLGIEYLHVEEHPGGSVKLGHRRLHCRTCGLRKTEIYHFPYPGALPQFVRYFYGYQELEGYLLTADPDNPDRERPTKDDFRAVLYARDNPWNTRAKRPARRPRRAAA